MGTPFAAIPRDLEQDIRQIKAQLRDLTGLALGRKRLGVDQGDFLVTGGGAVVVRGATSQAELAPDAIAIKTRAPGGPVPPNMVLLPDGFVAADGAGNIVVFRIDATTGNAVLTSSNQNLSLPNNVYGGKFHAYGPLETDQGLTVMGATQLNGPVRMSGLPTTGAGANVNWSLPNGALAVVTSTERHKNILGNADVDPAAVLALQEVLYTRKDDAAATNPTRYLGFIAERAHDLGLTAWVIYDEAGLPWSFDYVGFAAVAHQAVLRKHEADLAAARQRADDLEQRLTALEARMGPAA